MSSVGWSAGLTSGRYVLAALFVLAPVAASAQTDSQAWVVAGAGSATVRGDCQTCEGDYPYRHGPAILANLGYRLNPRADIGAEILWVPIAAGEDHVRVTHIDAVAQVRPWSGKGFFLKGGAGMAFVRNWVDAVGPDPINSKALSIVIGGGWAFRTDKRIGYQLFASQHAGALGDLQTSGGEIPDVMGNYWTIGAAFVFR